MSHALGDYDAGLRRHRDVRVRQDIVAYRPFSTSFQPDTSWQTACGDCGCRYPSSTETCRACKSPFVPMEVRALGTALLMAALLLMVHDEVSFNAAPKVCALCGHTMTFAKCGASSAHDDKGVPVVLCHGPDHSCYHLWTVYGARPGILAIYDAGLRQSRK